MGVVFFMMPNNSKNWNRKKPEFKEKKERNAYGTVSSIRTMVRSSLPYFA